MRRSASWRDPPPTQAGLAAALRRAYLLPDEDSAPYLEDLLRKLG